MLTIGLLKETKVPADNRVALTPAQCKWLIKNVADVNVIVQASENRCFTDDEYRKAGITVAEQVDRADFLLGIKEVKKETIIAGKTYLFFSHTKKLQPYNQAMFLALQNKGTTLIDYECLEYNDGARILGFGFFAGVVGAHNGLLAYGNRTKAFYLPKIKPNQNIRNLIDAYFGLKLPPIKIAVTGSGRVAHGILEVMNLLGIHEVEPEDYLGRSFDYPVYVQLKGADLYERKDGKPYSRIDFHENPQAYTSKFQPYTQVTDVLMNGIYWDENIPRLFENADVQLPTFTIQTIADITDDAYGSVPINLGDATLGNPTYGVDKRTLQKTDPYLTSSIDVMAVGNLPNELPRDASKYFGEQLIKYVLDDLLHKPASEIITRATILKNGKLTPAYQYMEPYALATAEVK